MDVVVSGRHCEISSGFREHVEEKLSRLEKHDHRLIRMEVQVEQDVSPKPDCAVKVELTARSRGPVVRAEACATDKMAALDIALDKMAAQMRKANDRRKVHRGQRRPTPLRTALLTEVAAGAEDLGEESGTRTVAGMSVEGDGPLVVREKQFPAQPISLDQALHEMELVGHDFYLFVEVESGRPSVVYRRHGYDYGVIGLQLDGQDEGGARAAEG